MCCSVLDDWPWPWELIQMHVLGMKGLQCMATRTHISLCTCICICSLGQYTSWYVHPFRYGYLWNLCCFSFRPSRNITLETIFLLKKNHVPVYSDYVMGSKPQVGDVRPTSWFFVIIGHLNCHLNALQYLQFEINILWLQLWALCSHFQIQNLYS